MKELIYDQIFTVDVYIYLKKRCITKLKFWSFEIVVFDGEKKFSAKNRKRNWFAKFQSDEFTVEATTALRRATTRSCWRCDTRPQRVSFGL